MPDEARSTLATVRIEGGQQQVVIAYYLGEVAPPSPGHLPKIYFPFAEASVEIPSFGVSARAIASDDFGLIIPAQRPLGDLSDLLCFDVATYEGLRERYSELLSEAIDHRWLLGYGANGEPAVAHDLSVVLNLISERALAPYYDLAMQDIRRWLAAHGYPFSRR